MSHAEPSQPLPIAEHENEPLAPDNTNPTLVTRPLSNFEYTEVRWRFDILRPCGIRDRKLRDYRTQAATVLGQVYDRDALCQYLLGRMSQEVFRTFSRTLWLAIIRAALLQGATLYEGNNFKTVAIVFPPGRCIDRERMRCCALNGFKDIWRLTGQNGAKRLLDGYCRVSREMRREALGDRGAFCIFALGTIHAHQAKGLARTLITKLQALAYDAGVPLWIETAVPRTRDTLLTLGFMVDSERHVGMGECTNDGKFVNNEPLTGILVFGMIWNPRPGPYLFMNTPAEQDPLPPAADQPSGQETPTGAIVIPKGSRAERPRNDTSIAQSSTAELSGDEGPVTGPMEFDERTRLLDAMSSQAVDEGPSLADLPSQAIETCLTAPVPIQAGQTQTGPIEVGAPQKARRGRAGARKPDPSASGARALAETIEEESDVSPKPSKADRGIVLPDKGLEEALFADGSAEGETGKGKSALLEAPEGENGYSQPASDESSTDSYMKKHLRFDEDVGEEDIDTRQSVQQEIDTLR
ncbi:hypothetical protein BJX68DRAFT_267025 [Aspergillus pseudodeflectus]|uniref:N-acetyltransferase domain-containing protein n=1 Tax=Aspergillus pseudodeflectus TaxID=176178 RepID=A0ABR4KBR6_9EURO